MGGCGHPCHVEYAGCDETHGHVIRVCRDCLEHPEEDEEVEERGVDVEEEERNAERGAEIAAEKSGEEIAEQEVEEEAARMAEHVEKKKMRTLKPKKVKKAKHVPAEQKQGAEVPKAKPTAKKQRKVSMKKKQLLKLKSFLAPSPVVELLVERIPEGLADASMEILRQMGIKK